MSLASAITAAKIESLDAATRAAAGDVTVTDPEAAAVAALYAELKLAGVVSPINEWVDKVRGAGVENFVTS